MLSTNPNSTSCSVSSFKVQRVRPSGGWLHANNTKRASASPVSFASASGARLIVQRGLESTHDEAFADVRDGIWAAPERLGDLAVTSPFSVAAVSEQKDACSSEDASAVNTFFEVCFVVGAFSFGQVHPHGLCHG